MNGLFHFLLLVLSSGPSAISVIQIEKPWQYPLLFPPLSALSHTDPDAFGLNAFAIDSILSGFYTRIYPHFCCKTSSARRLALVTALLKNFNCPIIKEQILPSQHYT